MKYIYDILLNFDEELYEFYEWKEEDYFDYIKKIAIIKVTKDTFNELKTNKIIIDNDFIDTIYNTCEVYTNNNIKLNQYVCLFACNSNVIAIEFNCKGISIMKSDLLIDEAMDIVEVCKKIKPIELKYTIIDKDEKKLMTRYEKEKLLFMKREINNMYKNNNIEKLKYLYYECFNKNEDSSIEIYNNLVHHIDNCPQKLYELLMLSYNSTYKYN